MVAAAPSGGDGVAVASPAAPSRDVSSEVTGLAEALARAETGEDAADACLSLFNCLQEDAHSLHVSAAVGEQAQLAVLVALRAHPSYAGMQETGCGALKALHDHARVLPSCHDAALAAMRAHPTSQHVQFHAVGALQTVWLNGDAALQRAIVDAGASEAVVAAMRSDASFALLQARGCWMLRRMRGRLPGDGAGVADGVLDAILAALRAHMADCTTEVVPGALAALHDVVNGHAALGLQATDAGAIPLVLAAMRAHAAVLSVQDWGISVLCCMSRAHAPAQTIMADAGAVAVALAVLATADARMQHQSLVLLMSPLLVNSMGAAESSRVLRAVADVLSTRPDDMWLQHAGMTVLIALANACHITPSSAGVDDMLYVAAAALAAACRGVRTNEALHSESASSAASVCCWCTDDTDTDTSQRAIDACHAGAM
jgi:hypothetical protein